MPLSPEMVNARINLRVAELRVIGALTGVAYGRMIIPPPRRRVVATLPGRRHLRQAFLVGVAVGMRRARLS